jgi:hypothetical protein
MRKFALVAAFLLAAAPAFAEQTATASAAKKTGDAAKATGKVCSRTRSVTTCRT